VVEKDFSFIKSEKLVRFING